MPAHHTQHDHFDEEGDYSMNDSSHSDQDSYQDDYYHDAEEEEEEEEDEEEDDGVVFGDEDDIYDDIVEHSDLYGNSDEDGEDGDEDEDGFVEYEGSPAFGRDNVDRIITGNHDETRQLPDGSILQSFQIPRNGDPSDMRNLLLRVMNQAMGEQGQNININANPNNTGTTPNGNNNNNEEERMNDIFSHLMRHIGQGAGRTRGAHSTEEYDKIVKNIENAVSDPYLALESLKKISTDILLMNPHILNRLIPLKPLSRKVINILKNVPLRSHAELQLAASNCLENIYGVDEDVTFSTVAHENVLQVLKESLQDMTFIDLAEQNLSLLNILSKFCSRSVLKSGIIQDVYNFIDFFPSHAQSKFLDTVSNSLTRTHASDIEAVKEISTLVTNMTLMNSQDRTCLNKCIKIYYNVCANFPNKTFSKLIDPQVPIKIMDHLIRSKSDIDLDISFKILEILLSLIDSNEIYTQAVLENRGKFSSFFNEFMNSFKKREESTLVDILPSVSINHLRAMLKLMIAIVYKKEQANMNENHEESLKSSNENQYMEDELIPYPGYGTTTIEFFHQEYFEFINDVLPLVVQILSHTQDSLTTSYCLLFVNYCTTLLQNHGLKPETIDLANFVSVMSSKVFTLKKLFQQNFNKHNFQVDYSLKCAIQILTTIIQTDNETRDKYVGLLKHEGLSRLILSLKDFLETNFKDLTEQLIHCKEEYDTCSDPEKFSHLSMENWIAVEKFVYPEKFTSSELVERQKSYYKKTHKNSHGEDYYQDIEPGAYDDPLEYESMLETGLECVEDAFLDLSNAIFKSMFVKKFVSHMQKDLEDFENTYNSLKIDGHDDEFQLNLTNISEKLGKCDVSNTSGEYWNDIWSGLKTCLFNSKGDTLSCFELIEIGLLGSITKIVKNAPKECIYSLVNILGHENMTDFVSLLQNCIDRFETFKQPYLFNLSDIKRDFQYLNESIKIELKYYGDADDDDIPKTLRSYFINVQPLMHIETIECVVKDLWTKCINKDKSFAVEEKTRLIEESKNWDFVLYDSSFKPIDKNMTTVGKLITAFSKERTSESKFNWYSVIGSVQWKFKRVPKPVDNAAESIAEREDIISPSQLQRQKFKAAGDGYAHKFDALVPIDSNVKNALDLILAISSVNSLNNCDPACFVNNKLTTKLHLQLTQPLITLPGLISDWVFHLSSHYPMIFTYEAREKLITDTCRGTGRLFNSWVTELFGNKEDNNEGMGNDLGALLWRFGAMSDHKLIIDRKNIFDESFKHLEKVSDSTSVLSVNYTGEKGEGSGPTMEFYSIMSKKFTMKTLGMWRESTYLDENVNDDEHMTDYDKEEDSQTSSQIKEENDYNLEELFPVPLLFGDVKNNEICKSFEYLGVFLARSLLDLKMVDFRFNEVFFKIIHEYVKIQNNNDQTYSSDTLNNNKIKFVDDLTIEDGIELIMKVDKNLGNSFKVINEEGVRNYKNRNGDLVDLCIPYNLPGFETYPLSGLSKFTSDQEYVTNENYQEYLKQCINLILGEGILPSIKSFLKGFNKVLPYKGLLFLTPKETSLYFGKIDEDWSFETITKSLNADHGYTMDSIEVINLITIMSSLEKDERRLFLQFATSSPRLPIGGFKKLRPKLLIALKPAAENSTPDNTLPSVMTCVNYFKLPQYSTIDIMRKRILQAITEGSSEFSFT